MELLWKVIAASLFAVILGLTLSKQEKDIGIVLILAVCAIGVTAAMSYLKPVLQFLNDLETEAKIHGETLRILLKIAGIGIVTEVAALICSDCGNGSLGKTLHLLGTSTILYLALPLFTALLNLIQQILGEV